MRDLAANCGSQDQPCVAHAACGPRRLCFWKSGLLRSGLAKAAVLGGKVALASSLRSKRLQRGLIERFSRPGCSSQEPDRPVDGKRCWISI